MDAEPLIVAETHEGVAEITGLVHDWWFDAGAVRHDRSRRTVTIGVARLQSGVQTPALWIVVYDVEQYHLRESVNVGHYDLNELRYDAASRTLNIVTGIPLEFEIRVSRLDVRLE